MGGPDDDFELSDDDAPDAPPKNSKGKKKLPQANQRTLRVASSNDQPKPEDWRRSLAYNEQGGITKDPGNAALIIANDERWSGALQYDEFADRVTWARSAPALFGLPTPKEGAKLDEQAVTHAQQWLKKAIGPSFAREATKHAILAAAHAHTFHPVRDYLETLRWDGVRRLDGWLPTYVGATDDRYHREVGRMWLVSAIARVLQPGCQADYMLVLEGPQGRKKSSVLRVLGGDWTLEGLPDLRDQVRAATQIQGKWLIEVCELHAIKGLSVTLVKQWLTMRVDCYRAAYAEFSRDAPRQCIFAGTTNEDRYLVDSTGGRRFWPVKCGEIRLRELARDRDQLWAEALECYRGGGKWWPQDEDEELGAMLEQAQGERYAEDEWERRIAVWAATRHEGFTTGEVLASCMDIEPSHWDMASQKRVGEVLRRLKFEPRQARENGIRVRRYYHPT